MLGPRRLGMLVIAALSGYRKREGINFSISAIIRHDSLSVLAQGLGADSIINIRSGHSHLEQNFDIVYDTTGKTEGFEVALSLSRRVVHVKTTNGLPTAGV